MSNATAASVALDISDVISGVDAARRRVASHVEDFDASIETAQIEQLIFGVLSAYGEEAGWSPRAAHFAAEVIGVGALSRLHYEEAELTYDDILAFLPHLGEIWNSWKHGGPQ